MSYVVTEIQLDASDGELRRPTIWVNAILREPPRFPGAIATRAFHIPPSLIDVARQIDVGDEIEIHMTASSQPIPVIDSMAGMRLVRKGPVDWRQWPASATR